MPIHFLSILTLCHFPGGTVVKNPPANSGNECSIPRSGRSPGGKNGNPLKYSYQENSMDRGAWKAVIHGVAQNWIQLSEHTLSTDNLISSVQFSHSVVSNSLQPLGLQQARLPCPSTTPGVYPNSCLLSWWCHPTISFSVIPSPPALKLSQYQGLFKWVKSLHQVAKLLDFQLQNQSFQ